MSDKCKIHEQFKICCIILIIIPLCALTVIGIVLLIEHKIDADKRAFSELVKHSSKTYVRNGYWYDKQISCSKEAPCVMNCLEYNRFIIGCGPDNPTCTHGHYDWCKDKPAHGQI